MHRLAPEMFDIYGFIPLIRGLSQLNTSKHQPDFYSSPVSFTNSSQLLKTVLVGISLAQWVSRRQYAACLEAWLWFNLHVLPFSLSLSPLSCLCSPLHYYINRTVLTLKLIIMCFGWFSLFFLHFNKMDTCKTFWYFMDLLCQKWWNEALYGPHESMSNPISPEMFAVGFQLGIQWLSLIF